MSFPFIVIVAMYKHIYNVMHSHINFGRVQTPSVCEIILSMVRYRYTEQFEEDCVTIAIATVLQRHLFSI